MPTPNLTASDIAKGIEMIKSVASSLGYPDAEVSFSGTDTEPNVDPTRYDDLLEIVEVNEQAMGENATQVDPAEIVAYRYSLAADLALNAAELAQAEQLRISNLLRVAALMSGETGRKAQAMALEALGLS